MAEYKEETGSDPLLLFCKDVLSSNLQSWPPSEDTLARAFISRFPVWSVLMEDAANTLCERLGINVSYRQLPDLSGFYEVYGEKREIILSDIENPLGISTHTLFHEIREIIERVFINLGHPTILEAEKEKRLRSLQLQSD